MVNRKDFDIILCFNPVHNPVIPFYQFPDLVVFELRNNPAGFRHGF